MARVIRTDPAQQAAVSGVGIPQGASFLESLAALTELKERGANRTRATIESFMRANPDAFTSLIAKEGFLETLLQTQAEKDAPKTGTKGSKFQGPVAPQKPSIEQQTQEGAAAFIKKRERLAAEKLAFERKKSSDAAKKTMASFLVGKDKNAPENFNAVQRLFLSEDPAEQEEAWRFLNENASASMQRFSATPEIRTLMDTARIGHAVGTFRSVAEGLQELTKAAATNEQMEALNIELKFMRLQIDGFTLQSLSNRAEDRGFMLAKEQETFRGKILDLQGDLQDVLKELDTIAEDRKVRESREGSTFGPVASPETEAQLRQQAAAIRQAITAAEAILTRFSRKPSTKGATTAEEAFLEMQALDAEAQGK